MPGQEAGMALLMTVMLLLVMLLLSMSAARIVLESQKLARNERDRLIAFHAAEAGLRDAERSLAILVAARAPDADPCARPGDAQAPMPTPDCGPGLSEAASVVCPSLTQDFPLWQRIDLASDDPDACLTRYGQISGDRFPSGEGARPAKPPRYVIEALAVPAKAAHGAIRHGVYRITAMGFGMRETAQVVLQTVYRPAGPGEDGASPLPGTPSQQTTGRISWREITHWREMHELATRTTSGPLTGAANGAIS